jgi:hypothetical protein
MIMLGCPVFARMPGTTRQYPASPEPSWNDARHLQAFAACLRDNRLICA